MMDTSILVGIISFISLLALIVLGMPVGFAMALIGFVGFWILGGLQPAFAMFASIPYESVTLYSFTVVPLFIFMGNLAFRAGFGEELFSTARKWVGHFPGGLAQATVLGSALFGAACGSTVASSVTMSRVAVPEMKKYGYDKGLATSSVAASGTIASMIPPSIAIVLYAMVTEESVGRMLMAGFLPGFLMAFSYMAMISIRCRLNKKLGPAMPPATWRERFIAFKGMWGIVVLGVCVMGGIYSGIITPTEAGGAGAFGALVVGFLSRRINLRSLWDSMLDTARTVGMIFCIVVGAFTYNALFALTQIPGVVGEWIMHLPIAPIWVLLVIMLFFIALGTFMDGVAILFLTMPVIYPIAKAMGWHPIWFGILFIHVYEMGQITPPFGLTLFATKAALEDVTMDEVIRGIVPFIIADFVSLGLLVVFPQIALFLPSMMKG